MTKHTPGPWKITNEVPLRASHQHQIGTNDKTVAYTWLPQKNDEQTDEEHEANARLISAAPELLEALELALHVRGTSEDTPAVRDKMASTLAKAKGE